MFPFSALRGAGKALEELHKYSSHGHTSNSGTIPMQMLEFRVLNIRTATQQFRGRLPLTPGSRLTWFGFSEEGHLSAFDSKVNLTLKLVVLDTCVFLRVDLV